MIQKRQKLVKLGDDYNRNHIISMSDLMQVNEHDIPTEIDDELELDINILHERKSLMKTSIYNASRDN